MFAGFNFRSNMIHNGSWAEAGIRAINPNIDIGYLTPVQDKLVAF